MTLVFVHLAVLYQRLPDWNSDISIWVAAVKAEPKDPWNLNNAAHFTHDNRSMNWLIKITQLDIPHWLPIDEREPYYIGYLSLANTFKINGYEDAYYQVQNLMATKLIDRAPPKVTYVVK